MQTVFSQETRDGVFREGDDALKAPQSLEESGISKSFVYDLLLKHLYRNGECGGTALAGKLCLPFVVLDEVLDEVVSRKVAEKRGGKGLGNAADVFGLTQQGRQCVHELLEIDTYTGPVPVPLDQYKEVMQRHSVRNTSVNEAMLREAWRELVLDEDLFQQIGPAMCSGKSCFLYGPPGTGKSTLAKAVSRFFDHHGGHVPVPHAVLVGGSVIRVYDPVYHQLVSVPKNAPIEVWMTDPVQDKRWVLCHRPTVIVGGELTLDMLDLRYNPTTKYYEAPLQMKANAGVFVIDDFGRQVVKPKDLLNRWIIPLEEHIDYLTLHTGKKFSIPFEEMVAFATNLEPSELADEAFLRRIRYRIYVGELSEQAYRSIFADECRKKALAFIEEDLSRFIRKQYQEKKKPMRACDPRDLTDAALDRIRFQGLPQTVTFDLLTQVSWQR